MNGYTYNWMVEMDDGRDRTDTRARAKCANCLGLFHPVTLSRDGLCELCVGRAMDDAKAMRAESTRTP